MDFQQTIKIKDFVILPRKIRDDYFDRKLTKNELDVLIWIWLNTNPYNGFFSADYKALEREFQSRISYDNIRKIISSLRKKQYIYFLNHKGRKGSFPVYPIDFLLTNGEIQTLDYLKNKFSITNQSQPNTRLEAKQENNLEGQYHKIKEQKAGLIKRFSMDSQSLQITTPYNDNDTKNNNIIGKEKYLKESDNWFAYKKIIPVDSFFPKTYEQQRCQEIAKNLGETDMRFILSCLRRYGFNHIERAWGIFQEILHEGKTKPQNPRKYFNKLIRNLIKN